MRRVLRLYETSVGKKVVMAVTGAILFGFVVGHMLGNLKIFTGEEHFNDYAVFLRTVGEPAVPAGGLLWIARLALLGCVGLHFVAAVQTWMTSRSARTQGYKKNENLSFTYASRTMRWGGVIILAFVVYHLLHLTVGVAHPDFIGADHPQAWEHHVNAYQNVVAGFRVWWVSALYTVAMIFLGLHIHHGVWSVTQTLSFAGTRIKRWRRPFATAVALVIVLGNISIPLSILAGWVGG
jgi:succinate dehydrogenase / fumarate reductase cytochrome b subunit